MSLIRFYHSPYNIQVIKPVINKNEGEKHNFHDAVWADKQRETTTPVWVFFNLEQDGWLFSQISLVSWLTERIETMSHFTNSATRQGNINNVQICSLT